MGTLTPADCQYDAVKHWQTKFIYSSKTNLQQCGKNCVEKFTSKLRPSQTYWYDKTETEQNLHNIILIWGTGVTGEVVEDGKRLTMQTYTGF